MKHPSFSHRLTGPLLFYLVAAVVVQLAAHVMRAYKSRLLINSIRPAKTRVLFSGLSVGFLFNSLLPFRLGELIRAFYVGDALAISKTAVFISIIIERIVDGLILGLCFISASLVLNTTIAGSASPLLIHTGLGLVILSCVLMLAISAIRSESKVMLQLVRNCSAIFNERISSRLRFTAWSGIYGTRLMLANPKVIRRYFILSVGMWVLYFASIGLVAIGFFHNIGFSRLWYVIQSTYAGVSAPAGPGYLGSFQPLVSQLTAKLDLASVIGFSSLIWLVLVTPISVVGLIVLARQKFGRTQMTSTQELFVNKLHREKDISQELANFLEAYFKGEQINQILTQAELDNKFKLIRSFRGGSNAQTMLVWQAEQLRVKKITLIEYADKLQAQADWLLARQYLEHMPKFIEQERAERYYSFDLEFNEDYVPFFEFIHSNSAAVSSDILGRIVTFMRHSIYDPQPVKRGAKRLEDYIETKIIGKLNDTATISVEISQLIGYGEITINGMSYPNIAQVVDKIKANKKAMSELSHYTESAIHGDLTVDNLIVSVAHDYMILDPNNENEVSTPAVDYGKLYQSLHSGYEFLIQLEHCDVVDAKVNFEEAKSQKYAAIFRTFDKKLRKELAPEEYRTILFHEAVHYCRMLTYRANIVPETVPVFYSVAVRLFNEFLKQYE